MGDPEFFERWTLNPPGADTYAEGKRDAKREVASILRAFLKGGG